jgi:glc operon protein GlcG
MTRALRGMVLASAFVGLVASAHTAMAQTPAQAPPPPPPPYGPAITYAQAQKAMMAAEAEARKNSWNVVIAIIDSGGHLVMLHRLDNTQYGSIDVAKGKATTAVNFRRPSKAFEDVIAGGGAGLRILALSGATPLEGGIPIVVDGKIIGGIGVSGVTSAQDAQIARAGADGLK